MAERPQARITRLPHGVGLPLPDYHSAGAAGMDLVAAIAPHQTVVLAPGARTAVPTGIAVALPQGHEGQVRPRSGMARNNGVTVLNAPGTIDSDYRGEIEVLLINHGDAPLEIVRGDRIAQLVIHAFVQAQLTEVDALDETARGDGGFGSTGRSGA